MKCAYSYRIPCDIASSWLCSLVTLLSCQRIMSCRYPQLKRKDAFNNWSHVDFHADVWDFQCVQSWREASGMFCPWRPLHRGHQSLLARGFHVPCTWWKSGPWYLSEAWLLILISAFVDLQHYETMNGSESKKRETLVWSHLGFSPTDSSLIYAAPWIVLAWR